MERTFARRLWVSSLVAAGAAATASACTSTDPTLPVDPNPVLVTDHAPPPISGGTLLVTDQGLAVAADSDRDLVWLVDLATKKVKSVALQKGDEPGRVIADGAGRVHVVLRGAGAVATLDLASQKIVDRTAVCSAPRGLAFDAAADNVHVACAGGELVTLPAAGGAAVRSLRFADRDLRDVVMAGDGLLVTRFRSAEVLALDAQGTVLNRQTPFGGDGFGTSFTPTVAWRALPAPGGGLLMMHQLSADSPVVIEQPGGYGSSGSPDTGCDGSIVHSAITQFDASGDLFPGGAPTINGASVPVDLAVNADGNFAVASAGSDALFFLQSFDVAPSGVPCVNGSVVPLPGQPVAVAAGPTGFVAQIREISDPTDSAFKVPALAGKTGPALVVVDETGVLSSIYLAGATMANTGHGLFHHNAAPASPLTCASCHPEGHEDGHVWFFDTLGARRTQTVSGGVLATAPLHWNGDMTGLPDIMHEVFQHRMGGPVQGPRHVEAFGEWLDKIPAHPASPTGSTAQVSHGKELFERADVGCTGCHSGAHFTNNLTVDVGTGQAFQVPSLIGVAARRPYMHDGCAQTLADRFDLANATCNGGAKHGDISKLSPADLGDLVAYLETL